MIEAAERFWSKVTPTGFCWEWDGYIRTEAGYGAFWFEGKNVMAHRWAYEFLVGPIPEELDLDHLCRNTGCVNPDHTEPVTRGVNNLRSFNVSGTNARKTHCKRGHEFTSENTYTYPAGGRSCRICRAETSAEANSNRRALSLEGQGCLLDDCNRKHYGRGLCDKHYKWSKYNGTFEQIALPRKRNLQLLHPKEG